MIEYTFRVIGGTFHDHQKRSSRDWTGVGKWGTGFQGKIITPQGLAQHVFLGKVVLSHMTMRESPGFT